MTIHTQKVQRAIQMFKNGELPAGKVENIQSEQNIADTYSSLRDEVREADNSDLDSDGRPDHVTFQDGNRIGYSFVLDGDKMTKSIERKGYTTIDEYTFSPDGIERLSATHDVNLNGTAAGSITSDKVSVDGASVTRESWWLDVDKKWEAFMTPNVTVDL